MIRINTKVEIILVLHLVVLHAVRLDQRVASQVARRDAFNDGRYRDTIDEARHASRVKVIDRHREA
jgi:steroid 5-alpha reductase family enzyme